MQELLAIIAKGLVDEPDAVSVDKDEPAEDGTVTYHIHVAEPDMGRIIGKKGKRKRKMLPGLGGMPLDGTGNMGGMGGSGGNMPF